MRATELIYSGIKWRIVQVDVVDIAVQCRNLRGGISVKQKLDDDEFYAKTYFTCIVAHARRYIKVNLRLDTFDKPAAPFFTIPLL